MAAERYAPQIAYVLAGPATSRTWAGPLVVTFHERRNAGLQEFAVTLTSDCGMLAVAPHVGTLWRPGRERLVGLVNASLSGRHSAPQNALERASLVLGEMLGY